MIFTLNLRTLRPLRLCGRYSEFRLRLSRTGCFVVTTNTKQLCRIFSMFVACVFAPGYARAQSAWQSEWEKTLEAAKQERKVVVGIPPKRGIEERARERVQGKVWI